MAIDAKSFRNPKSAFEIQCKVYCILGDERVFNSKSPEMFTAVFQRVGLRGIYVPFMTSLECVGEALNSMRVLNIAGANVTVPYKEGVIPFLDVLSEGAKIIGAINTIAWEGDVLKGYNTNAIGFMDALAAMQFEAAGKRALIFGSGGVARSVAFILNWLRAEKVTIVGRDKERTWALAERFSGHALLFSDLDGRKFSEDIVINTTSVSNADESPELHDHISRLDLSGCQLILDLNYGRRENFWKKRALDLNLPFHDGLAALAFQARRTFALWTGMEVPPEAFLDALQ